MSNHTKDNSQLPYSHLHFPAKLYQIIEEESDEIICWKEDGLSFRIVEHGRFERELMPKYFRHGNISSVQRQLNLYGFKCVGRGENKGCFFHPDFKRGEFEIVKQIRRNPRNKKGLRDKSSASYFLLSNKTNSYKNNNNNNDNNSNHNNNVSNSNTAAETSSTNSSILDGDGQVIYDGTDDIFSEKHTDLFETIPNIFFNGNSNSNSYNNELYHLRERKSYKGDDNSYEDATSSSSNELPAKVSAMSASLSEKVKKNLGQQYHQTLVNRVGNSGLNPKFSDYISNFYSFDQIEAQFINNTPKMQQQQQQQQQQSAKKNELPPSEPYTSSDSVEDLFKFCQSLEDYYTVSQSNSHQPAQNASTDQDNEQNQKASQQYRRQPLTKQQQQQYQYYTQQLGQKWN